MKMKSSREDRTIQYFSTDYTLDFGNGRIETGLSRERAAMWRRIFRTAGLPVPKATGTLRLRSATANLCAGCKARPSRWEMDCDGPYDTVNCGVCDWWACNEAQDKARVLACQQMAPGRHETYLNGHNCFSVVPW